jgi:acyl carrier protein
MQQQDLMTAVMDWVRSHTRAADAASLSLAPDTDLLATGWLDSLGFVDLLAFAEKATGRDIDLADADPVEFTTVRGFCRLALRDGGRSATR